MMRVNKARNRKPNTGNTKQAAVKHQPSTEGITPLNGQGHRDWLSLSDEKLISYANNFMKERGISRRGELSKVDPGLYIVLRKRKLLDKVIFEDKKQKQRPWIQMKDEEIIEHAKRFMEERGISGRTELRKADPGLYSVLGRRELLDMVGFEEKQRLWKEIPDDELIKHAKTFIREKGIDARTKLQKADNGLHYILKKRGLLDRVGLSNRNKEHRDWSSLTDQELVSYANKFLKLKKITGKKELEDADNGVYNILMRRRLLDCVSFKGKRRKQRFWKQMKDEEIIECAKKFIDQNRISGRHGLRKADLGLYEILKKRKLLDFVFSPLEQSASEKAIEQVIDFTRDFC